MSSTTTAATPISRLEVRPSPAGFFKDMALIAGRALRLLLRDPESVVPGLIVPAFFLVVNTGALASFTENNMGEGFNYVAFQVPVAIIFGVTGQSRALTLVFDIQGGYFSRLLLTPVRRGTLLLGLMVADFTLGFCLSIPVLLLGLAMGSGLGTGVAGALMICLIAGLWTLAFAGFPYAIALKTGNPAAVNLTWMLFMPFAFLTSAFLPQDALSGWLATVAKYNPVTYILDAMRSLMYGPWSWTEIGQGLLAIGLVGAIGFTLSFVALRGRLTRS